MGREWIQPKYQGKNIVVIGTGKSGLAVAKLLHDVGAQVTINDRRERQSCQGIEELEQMGIICICGSHPDDVIHPQIDLVVKNPGVPYESPPIAKAMQLSIPVITEVEVAYDFIDVPFIAITGSNGKTTTTTLVGEMLKKGSFYPTVAGNIGRALSEVVLQEEQLSVIVAELSSFQLAGIQHFRPQIGCLLNLYPAHLDYHHTIEEYAKAKMNLFINQTKDDVAVLNWNSSLIRSLSHQIPSQKVWFSTSHEVPQGAFFQRGQLFYRPQREETILLMDRQEVALKGSHNVENALAAAAISLQWGVQPEHVVEVLKTFQGVEHRLEFVTELNGVKFYNDSKATNPQAAISSITSFTEPVVLIAGGLDRGIDFMELVPVFKEHVKGLITYGQTSEKLKKAGELAGLDRIKTVENVSSAAEASLSFAASGDVVLLSPACASWDMYSSFEERGSMFKQAVHRLVKEGL
ncbi:UDP-N-acetylmuramoyl-L-alanine--D-glutamate ligase [Microaerobacter geothermalis]|uniref:UDP-N-acetylmuramoyl-L-alanine--D-glutamate ligase n=1 Tax=Microaerobacter geothermalis TaxID=674972 RepID=UPI001F3D4A1C|nr:UDP-N-acetylmuramoyl-L-alanine--D-glutamate ligase [Microaerobacter geothermalis]MCF6093603.1 UDP-N-acetylmuramoyl-L-alanine--D-glutamate ligase [Microaerobacter geothermalis]